ncbi:hypothetical protein PR202_ga05693 [Eleusine coracana subsp. coracana]|uniref:Plant-specific domain TIGR01615 family protein n=1 Tax=Eleusine coracana subsp. coracana TaxID=191504 RepID=A0AAV5BV05_ELECO|nr:hypothetical protein QOZ80_5AG0366330 [Eleusine coracana subsp. coracana]GJM89094.1 hypothetical protein PR202_ga05239 [Eleusine coracana subsp. coracana]GJM89495.1 hypothetical protein PR202_ga05693 [Eleusine coracana subsp. coracana]
MVVGEATEMSLSNMVLGFYEEAERERWPEDAAVAGDGDGDEEGSSGGGRGSAASMAFWNEQRSQLHEALAKTSSAETRIRADTEEAVRQMRAAPGGVCSCSGRAAGGCRACALRFVAEKLRDAGYNSAICKSKWSRTLDIPSGEHTYVDVVVPTRSGKAVRVVIELNFRAEFEMARGGAEYNALVAALPEVFVGRTEKLRAVIKVMCAAAKQCARENHMHMAPWRKHRYMEAKWLGTPERVLPGAAADAVPVGETEEKQPKFRASMLTLDFGGRTAVEVV